ncbi:3564_t:CDS:2 [Diversispora eburnea]|uniref:3564_t:CDS:1 n=1 Tax=Diversispora eburnea TaxID=1213867 RepID=A0A9N9A8W0_9GLOM|nr:3564_t:CDS:2 [Diversispora eburnea]
MPEITVTVKCSNDQKYSVTIDTSKTVLDFKKAIAEKSETEVEKQRLIFSGRVLKDIDTLETYKIADGHTVHMVRGQVMRAQTQPRSPTTENTQTTQTTTPPQPGVDLFGAGAFGAFGGLNQGQFGANPFGGLQNPNPMMEQILQNPAVMQYMQQMLQDPTFVENMISLNPQLSQIAPQLRQMMQDPLFQSFMSNPETLRNMAAMHSMMGTPGMFPGTQGLNTPTTNPNTNTNTNPSSTGTTNDTTRSTTDTSNNNTTSAPNTTSASNTTPLNNPLFNFLAAAGAGTGNNQTQPPTMPQFDPSLFWGALGGMPQTQTSQVPPEERYQVQLQQLNEMGFYDPQRNIRALQMCSGNVNAAIERLLDPSFN